MHELGRIRLAWVVRTVEEIEAALSGLCALASVQLAARAYPPLYQSGVRYRAESGTEWWLGPRDVFRRGHGDCEDLVAWRVAELRAAGEVLARPACYSPQPGLVHCVVRRADGRIEDPSRVLGMGGVG